MKCQEVEAVISDLACNRLMEADVRKRALDHADSCVRCASRLSDERMLTAVLRLAASEETEEAPAYVRAALLAAIASRAARQADEKSTAWRKWRWQLVAAAMLMIAFAVTNWLHLLPARSPERMMATEAPNPPGGVSHLKRSTQQSSAPRVGIKQDTIIRPQPTAHHRRAHPVNAMDEDRALTEYYIPLTYLADSTAMESGQIVRVRLPRSALISLGLAMGAESMGELVEADVVLGDDGVARAIRLVQ
jgi:hypothetical protein